MYSQAREEEVEKEKNFEFFIKNVLHFFKPDIDFSKKEQLDVLDLKGGDIWDLENFVIEGGAKGMNLRENLSTPVFEEPI